ncbi:MAG TPA: pyridoxamine 5'-phosphate oxidase [Mycobacteriales bacterium]|jgi:pyridoxamine 5'-phosphate oxidase|nr:pyridoxamine 5'-phosphate oxidase [Mycobacteriales bacterium]
MDEDLPGTVVARREYTGGALDEAALAPEPMAQFAAWFADAVARGVPEPDAMCLATVSPEGAPASRMVLLKGWDERGFVFCTNYTSRKGVHLAASPVAALTFRWAAVERQVCVTGRTRRTTAKESDAWWALRPRGAQLGALASAQSSVLPSRAWLESRVATLASTYEGRDVPRPAYWGGVRVVPDTVELWQGRPNRLHDRLRYSRRSRGWRVERLAP